MTHIRRLLHSNSRRGPTAILLLAAILLLTATSAGSPSAAAAAGGFTATEKAPSKASDGYYLRLRNLKDQSKCMSVDGGDAVPDARVILWECGAQSDQQWWIKFDGFYQQIHNLTNGWMCLAVSGNSPNRGAHLVTSSCIGDNQHWWRLEASTECGGYILKNGFGQLASVDGGNIHNNASIIQWPHASSRDQTWCITW